MLTALFLVVLLAPTVLNPSSAWCLGCVPTFCGFSSECPPGCACVLQDEATGFCGNVR